MAFPNSPIPGAFFEWQDNSDIQAMQTTVNDGSNPSPLYAMVFTADKGVEDWKVLSGRDWFDMYAVNNVVDFSKHGQPLLQAAVSINAGARILCKRVCADDATLANIAIVARVTESEEQKTDTDGNKLYTGADGKETTEADGNEPIMVKTNTVRYHYKSATNCSTKEEVIAAINKDIEANVSTMPEGTTEYPLWIFFDNGRGDSKKRIRIDPNYALSKNAESYFMYDLNIMEGNKIFNTIHFVLSPNMISGTENISLAYRVNAESTQIEAYQYDDDIMSFMDTMIAATGGKIASPEGMDLLFGKNKKAKAIDGIVIDFEKGVDIAFSYGQVLQNGSNGEFGDVPFNSEKYGPQLAKAFAGYVVGADGNFSILNGKDGCYDPIIYNPDRYKIDVIPDANYPDIVKRAIEQLVTFREDCEYFRDMGTSCNTLELIRTKDENNLHNAFCTTYCTYYDVIDPYSRRKITVTMMYHMAQMMVTHLTTMRNAPMAGIRYGFTVDDDTVRESIAFTPTICPGLDEKEELAEMRINYATYIDNQLVVESLYTSQEKYTQLSFSNNVLAVQEIIKIIRSKIPASRYSFIDGADLDRYREDVEAIIEPYRANFAYLGIEYMSDPYYTANKIFFATLAFRFRDFVQTERFNIVALSSDNNG